MGTPRLVVSDRCRGNGGIGDGGDGGNGGGRGDPLKRAAVLIWLALAFLWLVIMLIGLGVWIGWRLADKSIDERGGMSPERHQQNLEHGKEILNGM